MHSTLASMHAIMLIRMLADCGYELQEVVPVQLISLRIRTRSPLRIMCGLGAKVQ
jgi:outer membrane lipopolysaccharide assembly protein LptE/RlpB